MILASLATDDIREFRDLSFRNKQAYSNAHGYFFAGITRSLDPMRPPSWSKIKLLELLCNNAAGEWAFWTDADSLIVRPEWDVKELADDSAEIVISKDRNGINCGSFLIRLGNHTRQFLLSVYDQTQFIQHRWWEQAAIRHLLEGGYPIRVKYVEKTLINAYPDDFHAGYSAIIHVPNQPKQWPDRIGELKKRMHPSPATP